MAERQINGPPELRRTVRLGEVLQRLMGRANLKQNELARRAGVSSASLTNYLRGHTRSGKPTFPTADILRQIAWGLGTNSLGERNTAAANKAYAELMQAIGYLDAPSLVYDPPLPPAVLDILAQHPELTVQIARTAHEWTPEATKMLVDALADYLARKVQRDEPPDECVR